MDELEENRAESEGSTSSCSICETSLRIWLLSAASADQFLTPSLYCKINSRNNGWAEETGVCSVHGKE